MAKLEVGRWPAGQPLDQRTVAEIWAKESGKLNWDVLAVAEAVPPDVL